MDINIKIDSFQALRALARLTRRSEDLSPAMEAISGVLADGIEQSFQTQSDPSGIGWLPLSAGTIAEREKKGYWPGKILSRTGRLGTSITASHGPRHAVAGTNVIYAATHQFGAARGKFGQTSTGRPIPWGDIPARPFLGITASGRREITDIISRYLGHSFA